MRKAILNLHLYVALVAGVFVIILGVTGAIMAFEDELDRIANPKLFHSAPTGERLSAVAILQRLGTAYPGQRFGSLRLPVTADDSYVASARGEQIFIDSYSGEIHGTRRGPTFLANVHSMHLRLMMGKTAGTIVGIVGITIFFLVISGVYLWWPLKRASVKWGVPARRVSFDLHNAVGIYSAAFLVILSITGAAIAFEDTVWPALYKMTNSQPPKRGVPSILQPGAPSISPDAAIVAASAALPGATPIAVTMPANPKAGYSVAMRLPEDLTPGGRSWVIVDQYSGKPLYVESSRHAPTGAAVEITNRAIHTGDIFGYFSKILMSLASLMLTLQVVTGYYLWWKKLRVKQPRIRETQPAA